MKAADDPTLQQPSALPPDPLTAADLALRATPLAADAPLLDPAADAVAAPTASRSWVASVSSLLIGYAILVTGNGLLGTLISLRLIADHATALTVGVVQSAYYLGFMFGAVSGGALIGRVGHHRAFVTFAAACACCALGYAGGGDAAVWTALRFVTGFCLVGIYTVVESWLNEVASNAQRARVFSAYLIVNYLCVGTGQFLLNLADPAGFALFSIVSALFSASLIPVALASQQSGAAATQTVGTSRFTLGLAGLRTVLRHTPLALVGCLAAGALNSAFYTMQPVFMRRSGASVAEVSSFMGCALIAALLLQWPVARLADRFDRRSIIFAVTTASALCSAIVFILRQGVLASAFNYLYVAIVFTLYGAIVSHANDTAPHGERVAVSAGLLLIFALGASAGPTLASATMALAGPAGLYLFTALITGALALLTARSLRGPRAVAS